MRIAMLSNLFTPVVSGSSTQSQSLARELVRRGHHVFVCTAHVEPVSPREQVIDGVRVYRLPCFRMPKLPLTLNCPWLSYTFLPGNLRRMEAIFRRHRPDVIHLHNHLFDMSLSAAWLRKQCRLPLVCTIHTMVRHARAAYNLVLTPGDRLLLRWLIGDRTDLMICPDGNMDAYVRQAFPRTRRTIVPYGINLPGQGDPATMRRIVETHGLDNKRVILSLGHIHDVRPRLDEIAAMPEILKAFPDARLLIVGKETISAPRALAERLGVSDAVIFAGPSPYEDVPSYLSLADVEMHLFTQDVQERTSLGIATEEVMAAGVPAVVSANAETLGPGVLSHGENVLNVPRNRPDVLANTVIDLLNDPDRRERIGQAGAAVIRNQCTWDAVCDQTLAAYRAAESRMRKPE